MHYWAPVNADVGGTENILNLVLDWLPIIPAPRHCFYFQKIYQGGGKYRHCNYTIKVNFTDNSEKWVFLYSSFTSFFKYVICVHLDLLMAYEKHALSGISDF